MDYVTKVVKLEMDETDELTLQDDEPSTQIFLNLPYLSASGEYF